MIKLSPLEILRDQQIGSFLKSELQKRVRLSVAVKAENEPEKLVKLILDHSNEEIEISNYFKDHEETNKAPDVEDILILNNVVSDKENFVSSLSRSIDRSFSSTRNLAIVLSSTSLSMASVLEFSPSACCRWNSLNDASKFALIF